ncbi:MAG: DUF4974 domain-containing protein [Ekhidna sp.]|nr:DUF4974 domain-containing protein [Ekhidna sp.]
MKIELEGCIESNRTFTGEFKENETLENVLASLTESLGAKYSISNGVAVISKACLQEN